MSESSKSIDQRISEACDSIGQKKKANIANLAREFDVPYHRLRARFHGRVSRTDRIGINKRLSEAQEAALVSWIRRLDDCFISPTPAMVAQCANQIITRSSKTEAPRQVSKNWAYRFIKRLPPDLLLIKQKPIECDRFEAEDIGILQAWFEKLRPFIESTPPRNIYNFDETGLQIGQGKDQKVITTNPYRASHLSSSGNRQSITDIECIAADGYTLPPYFLPKAEYHQEQWWRTCDLPKGAKIHPSQSGWITDKHAFEWLAHFDIYTKDRCQKDEYRLLLMDNHLSHRTFEFIEFCEQRKIILFCFPPHTTHLIQPLDGDAFLAYKAYYRAQNNKVVQWGGTTSDKADFFREIGKSHRTTFIHRIVRNSFKKRGIYPWDPSKILDQLHNREITPNLQIIDEPPPPTSSPIDVVFTPIQAKHSAQKANQFIEDISPELRRYLQRSTQRNIQYAELLEQERVDKQHLLGNMARRKAPKSKKRIQITGPLSLGDASRHINERDKKEAQSALRRATKAKNQDGIDEIIEARRRDQMMQDGTIEVGEANEPLFIIDTIGERA